MANYPASTSSDDNLYVQVNNKTTSLSAGISNSDTTIPVASTSGFPASGTVTVDLEIIAYTSLDATNFLGATRGFDGTTAVAHLTNALVSHNIIAKHHNVLKDETIAVETDLVAVQSALADLAPAATSADILTRIRQIVTQLKAITGTSNWYDAVAVALTGKLSLTGGTLTGALTVNPATNQVVLGGVSGGNTTTITAPAPAANRTVTIPDGGAPSSVVLTESSQTINGAKTFTDPITQNDTSNQVVLGVTNTTTINATAPAASRVVTIPDPGAAASFVMTEGTQTINGSKTITALIATLAANIVAAGFKLTGLAAGTANGDSVRFEQIFYGFQAAVQGTTTSPTSTTSSTFAATGLSASITPTSTSHRIKITVNAQALRNVNTAATNGQLTITRDGTNLGAANGFQSTGSAAEGSIDFPCSLSWIDSPASVASLTYAVAVRSSNNTNTVTFNVQSGTTSIILEEIV